ncbi:hypothetical protein O0L34_g12719 [Tuta absoluta]|nr:hypothetical protein O0L34_g12719 [Tuta absoluta]
MKRLEYLIIISAIISLSVAVKINMQGSMSLGKEIMQAMSQYIMHSGAMSLFSRRSGNGLSSVLTSDRIKLAIHSANIGKGVKIYSGPMKDFIKEYVTILAIAIDRIFEGIITNNEKTDQSLFMEQLKPLLLDINDILKDYDAKINEDNELSEWRTIIKRIAARYQKAVTKFVEDRVDGDPQDISNVRKKMIQKLVVAIVLVENKYEAKLCEKHQICEKNAIVTTGLQRLFGEFETVENVKSVDFIKNFYESLPEDFFYFLTMDTTHELQVILSDLGFTKNSPAKEVFRSLKKTIDTRLELLKNSTEMTKAFDQQLVNAILSDMDYFYRNPRKRYPFELFFDQVVAWLNNGGKLVQHIRPVLQDIKEHLSDHPRDLVEKLEFETRVFLELTVDPEK